MEQQPNIVIIDPNLPLQVTTISNNFLNVWRYFRQYKDYIEWEAWRHMNHDHDSYQYDRLIFCNEKFDNLGYQKKRILVYKKTTRGRLLTINTEDFEHISIFVDVYRAVGKIKRDIFGSPGSRDFAAVLPLLKEVACRILTCDYATSEYTHVQHGLDEMLKIITDNVLLENRIAAYKILCDWIQGTISVDDTVLLLEKFSHCTVVHSSIDPVGKDFQYNLDSYSCYRLRTGTCSLDLKGNQLEKAILQDKDSYSESSVHYCRNMQESILENGFYKEVEIQHNTICNHFSFTDGQHRICIAKRSGLQVPAKITNQQLYCLTCSSVRRGKESRMFID